MSTDQKRLEALRDRLEAILADPATTPRDVALVGRELRQTLAQLAAVAPADESSPLDDLAAQRRKRGAV